MLKTSLAVVTGMALVGAVLVAPGAAAPGSGRAVAWGWNAYGQVGNNSTTDSSVPVNTTSGVLTGKTVTAISAGAFHTCAIAGGRAYCWGRNDLGQLGNNSPASVDSAVPVPVNTDGVLAGKTVTALSAGESHTCAVADGRAYCWGYNGYGQLGSNGDIYSKVPVAVNTDGVLAGKTATAVAAGANHACVLADGRPYCWGRNDVGQSGDDTWNDSAVPVAVSTSGVLAGKTVTGITAGFGHTCAVAQGRAYCWGYGTSGQLGNNGTSNSKVPVAVYADGVLAGRTVTAVAAGYAYTCALAEGRASCWGDNMFGQLGNDSTTGSRVPVAVHTDGVLAGKTVTAVTTGYYHSCVSTDGRVYCWGFNGSGQLGNNSTASSKVPVAVDSSGVLSGKTVVAITAGGEHSAVLAAAVPQPPTGVIGVPGDEQVAVSWSPPADDGGSPVIDYVATAIPGGASCSAAGTSCVCAGLSNGTGYTFIVTARNAVGVSMGSTPSAPVTPTAATPLVQPAVKVKGVKAKVRKGTAKITWKAVAGATSYRVRISKPGGKQYKAWKTTSKRVFKTTVRKGTKYRFQVAAVGAGGRGPTTTIRFKGK